MEKRYKRAATLVAADMTLRPKQSPEMQVLRENVSARYVDTPYIVRSLGTPYPKPVIGRKTVVTDYRHDLDTWVDDADAWAEIVAEKMREIAGDTDTIPRPKGGRIAKPKATPETSTAEETKTFQSIEDMIKEIQGTKPRELPKVAVDLDLFAEYKEIAASLGFVTPDFARMEIESFCTDHNIPLYNLDDVNHYMDRIIGVERKNKGQSKLIWYWRGLSKQDKSFIAETDQYKGLGERGYSYRLPEIKDLSGYDKSIPLHVLKRAKVINDHFNKPGQPRVVNFTVSDYALVKPDPFIMGEYKGHKFVFGCWDEPTFGIEK